MPSPAARSAAYAGQVQDPGTRCEGTVHVLPAQRGSGGTCAVVEGACDIGRALFKEHHPGAAGGVLAVLHFDAFGAELAQDELAVRVGTHHAGPADPVAEPGDADGHIRFRPRHVHG
ncbi:hypothetical protein ACVWZ8_002191 [Arthrobacter sp. UYCu723]